MPDEYEAFISYRRGDASGIARWIRNRLQRYTLPPQVVAMLTPEKQELHRRKPRIYLDRAYEKAHSDFLQEKILPALDAAERLIVISTPSVFETIRDAKGEAPNWLVQEIEHFFADHPPDQPPRPIDVVIGPNGSIERFPGRLAERGRWDWIDLRAYSGWRALGFSEALDAGFTKLAAAIYDVPDVALPLMRQEERRRRRRIIMAISGITVCVLAALGFLGSSLWAETKARQAVDFERRLIVARGLLDTGDAPRAVQTLSGLAAEENPTYAAEARQALAAWSARLGTASDRFHALADGQVFRWHGRNYLKAGGQLRLAFDGPPTLQSAATKNGQLLITFDADRRLRIRDLTKPDTPLVETGGLDAATGRISELFGGRMILFQAQSLILLSDEDMEDAQDLGGDEVVLLDPASRTYAVQSEIAGEIRLEMTCEELRIAGTQIDLFQGNNETSGNRLVVSAAGSALHWDLSEADASAAGAVRVAAAAAPGGCAPTVLSDFPQQRRLPPVNRLQYPSTIPEAALWSATGTVPPLPEGPDLCPMEEAVADETPTDAPPADTTVADQPTVDAAARNDCFDAKGAISVYPEAADTLDMILRQYEVAPEVLDLGDTQRLAVIAVIGNQNYGLAYCAIGSDRSIGQCLATTPTARSSKRLRLQNQFLVLNGPEVHADMFQLIDLRSLHFMKVKPPLMEKLADVDFSADGTHMAALTARGEVWLYAVDRAQGSATALARFDFGGHADATKTAIAEAVPAAAGDAGDAGSGDAVSRNADAVAPVALQPNVFDTITYIGSDRLLLVGRHGGIVLADPGSGETLWARPAPQLLGQNPLAADVHAEANVIVLHDGQSARLLTMQSGILLSDAVDVAALAKPKEKPDGIYGRDRIGVQIAPSGEVKLTYHDVIIEPLTPRPSSLPSPAEIVRRTGANAAGRDVPLAELLAP